jgi:hypothetical protein
MLVWLALVLFMLLLLLLLLRLSVLLCRSWRFRKSTRSVNVLHVNVHAELRDWLFGPVPRRLVFHLQTLDGDDMVMMAR